MGSLYCLFQVAANYGYITVNWKKVEEDVMSAIDTNGDGKIDEKDASVYLAKVMEVLCNDELEGRVGEVMEVLCNDELEGRGFGW